MGKVTGEEGWISLGPWGSSGGSRKTYKADGPILQITLRLGKYDSGRVRYTILYSISFQSESRDGVVIGSSDHFGNPEQGGEATTVRIDTSVEQLRSISALGEAFEYLTFHTNLKDYGPYGYSQDYLNDRNSWNYTEKDRVSLGMYGGVIAGFYGYEDGGRLSGLGVFVVPIEGLHIIQYPDCAQHQKTEIEELKKKIKELETENEVLKKRNKEMEKEGSISGGEGCISSGIGGGKEGAYWTYKADGPVMLISVRYGEAIDSIIFQSKSGDGVGRSVKIGGTGGQTTKTFCIDSSIEQLSSISLTYEEFYGEVTIISLCFETNVGNNYGPFGSRSGASSESIPVKGGVFAGFHGRVGTYLTAFGILQAP
ncbi:mannose/glucose-specific lectin-like [Rhododendron vialii]|uniref:mannose/glucose-specific lectin-like n=1 Tax=Rhododendron vialii TaxID=182163 RepID=UPI00265F746D|nr:mannose/glucose-specific lectin-like [Rhododendron vialii]